MKIINKLNLRNLVQTLLNLTKLIYHGVLLCVTLNWPVSLKGLWELLSQDKLASQTEPEIEVVFKGKLAGEKRMYSEAIALRMPFHFLPSCSSFRVELGVYDWILALFGHSKRSPGTTKIRNWRNGAANKFVFHMFKKLAWYRDHGEMEKYWALAWVLMRSHAYQVMAYNWVRHNWHTGHASLNGLSLNRVVKELEQVKLLCNTKATEINFKRVYIPKSDDPADERKRPLGVPTPAWRVYLHMYNNLIVWARTGQEGSQHAYFPKRGVITAWRDVFLKLSSPNIMEFDLKSFFDAVNLEGLYRTMWSTMKIMPKVEAAFVRKLNRSIPKFPKLERGEVGVMDEPDLRLHFTADLNPNPNVSPEIDPAKQRMDWWSPPPLGGEESKLTPPKRADLSKERARLVAVGQEIGSLTTEFQQLLVELEAATQLLERLQISKEHLDLNPSLINQPGFATLSSELEELVEMRKEMFKAKRICGTKLKALSAEVVSLHEQIKSEEVNFHEQERLYYAHSDNGERGGYDGVGQAYGTSGQMGTSHETGFSRSAMNNPQPKPSAKALVFSPIEGGEIMVSQMVPAGTGWKEIGVPQGAATSCSVSTIALHEMHVVRQKEFSGYADDGLWFNPSHPDSLDESCKALTQYTGGVLVNKEKSQMLKVNGKWVVDSFKYLGVRYFPPKDLSLGEWKDSSSQEIHEVEILLWFTNLAISLWLLEEIFTMWIFLFSTLMMFMRYMKSAPHLPRGERLRADTRKGATLEFGIREQFLAWILLQREKWIESYNGTVKSRYNAPDTYPKFEGSAARLNSWIPSSARTWIFWEYMQFMKYSVGPRILFRGKFSGYFLSRLYLDTWNYKVEQDFRLDPMKGSWVRLWWLRYMVANRDHLYLSQLAHIASLGKSVAKLSRDLDSLATEASVLLLQVWATSKLLRTPYKEVASSTVSPVSASYKDSILLLDSENLKFPEDRLPSQAVRFGVTSLLEGLGIGKRLRVIIDERWPLGGIGKVAKPHATSRNTSWDLVTKKEQRILNILKEIVRKNLYFTKASFWLLSLGRVQLNIFNASTFAVDSLLRDYPFKRPLVRYYDPADAREDKRKALKNEKNLMSVIKLLVVRALQANLHAGVSFAKQDLLTMLGSLQQEINKYYFVLEKYKIIYLVNKFIYSLYKIIVFILAQLLRICWLLRDLSKAFIRCVPKRDKSRSMKRLSFAILDLITLLSAIALHEWFNSPGQESLEWSSYSEAWVSVLDSQKLQPIEGLKPNLENGSNSGLLLILLIILVTTVLGIGFTGPEILNPAVFVENSQFVSGYELASYVNYDELRFPQSVIAETAPRSPIFAYGYSELFNGLNI